MKIISFAWTTPAFLAGRKTRTRRLWDDSYAKTFKKGDHVQAWNKTPRVEGARRIGEIILTAEPFKQDVKLMPDEDYEKEGFAYLAEIGHKGIFWNDDPKAEFELWRERGGIYWVIDFKKVERPPTHESGEWN